MAAGHRDRAEATLDLVARRSANVAGLLLRSLEPALRVTWVRAVTSALPRVATEAPDWRTGIHRVLFVRYERIGDMIMATSLIRAIAKSHPTIRLDVLASPQNAPVLKLNPYVGRVLTLERKRVGSYVPVLRDIRRSGYDTVVDGRINSPRLFLTTSLIVLAARATYRVGWSNSTGGPAYNLRVGGKYAEDGPVHYIDASARLSEPFGVEAAEIDWRPEIFLAADERAKAEAAWPARDSHTRRLLVNLSVPDRRRRWSDSNFVEVIRGMQAHSRHLSVGVIGLPSEELSVRDVAGATGATPIRTPTLRDALAVVASSDFVFTVDTSISHAASAFSKPTVVIIRRDSASYAPYRVPGYVLLWDGDHINSVLPGPVLNAVLDLIAGADTGRSNVTQLPR